MYLVTILIYSILILSIARLLTLHHFWTTYKHNLIHKFVTFTKHVLSVLKYKEYNVIRSFVKMHVVKVVFCNAYVRVKINITFPNSILLAIKIGAKMNILNIYITGKCVNSSHQIHRGTYIVGPETMACL